MVCSHVCGMRCEVCGALLEAYTPGGAGVPPTYRCASCGLVQLRFKSESEAKAWKAYYTADGRYHRERVMDGFESFDARLQHDLRLARIRMENLMRFVKGGALLDVGTGNGALVTMAREYGFDAVGIEPDRWVVEQALMRGNKWIGCMAFEECHPALREKRFNVVTFIDSFEHLLSPHKALEKVRQLLSKWGLLVFEMPDADAPGFAEKGPNWKHFKPLEHAFLYGKSHVLRLLEMHRFSLIDTIVPYPDRRVYYAGKCFEV